MCRAFCAACQCSAEGSHYSRCDRLSGQCVCRPGVVGRRCDACTHGSYGFPSCQGNDAHLSDPSSHRSGEEPKPDRSITTAGDSGFRATAFILFFFFIFVFCCYSFLQGNKEIYIFFKSPINFKVTESFRTLALALALTPVLPWSSINEKHMSKKRNLRYDWRRSAGVNWARFHLDLLFLLFFIFFCFH